MIRSLPIISKSIMMQAVYAHSGSRQAAVLLLALTLAILPLEGTSDTSSSCLGELFSIGGRRAISVCWRFPANLDLPRQAGLYCVCHR